MARQADRSTATQGAILAAAMDLFGRQGFAGTSVDQIAAGAGVAKGAVYHHFATKEAVFEGVLAQVSEALAKDVMRGTRGGDVLASICAGTRLYYEACSKGPVGRIMLGDGPAVLGWERWRQLDAQHFGAMLPRALNAAMDQGLIARQPVEPLARLLLGAITETAVAVSAQGEDAAGYLEALERLLEGLRIR